MKIKTNKTNRLLTILFAACSLLITSCSHDPIFNIIDSEVKPEKNGICGHINSFVTFNSKLYIATNFLYEKPLASSSESNILNGGWTRIADTSTAPFTGRLISFIAADSNYLYAYTVTYGLDDAHNNVPDSVIIFYSEDARNWNKIDNEKFESLYTNSVKGKIISSENKPGAAVLAETNNPFRYVLKIFDNQALSASDKNAYCVFVSDIDAKGNMATKLFRLNGNNDLIEIPNGTNNSLNQNNIISKGEDSTPAAGYSPYYSQSAVHYKGSDYFFEYTGIIADDNYIYLSAENNTVMVADGWDSSKRVEKLSDIIKSYSVSSYGFTFEGNSCESAKSVKINCGNIISFGITKDKLLLGTRTGIAHVNFDTERIPGTGLQAFNSNAASVLHSPYHVLSIFVVDPSKNEDKTDIYAANEYEGYYSTSTTALFEDIGLWAYYPSRGNWNKDGTSSGKNKKTHLPAGN